MSLLSLSEVSILDTGKKLFGQRKMIIYRVNGLRLLGKWHIAEK